jgi:hypothetical protein
MRRPEAEDARVRALDVGHPRREGTIPALYALIEKSQLSFFPYFPYILVAKTLGWQEHDLNAPLNLPARLMPTTSKTKQDCCLRVMQRSP